MAIRSTKKADLLAHFEAPELSYPKMIFPRPFWNLPNHSKSAPKAPKTFQNQVQELENLRPDLGSDLIENCRVWNVSKQPQEPPNSLLSHSWLASRIQLLALACTACIHPACITQAAGQRGPFTSPHFTSRSNGGIPIAFWRR